MSDLGRKIYITRCGKNWPMRELADKSGISASYICKIENNELVPSFEVLKKLTEALELPSRTLIDLAIKEKVVRVSSKDKQLVTYKGEDVDQFILLIQEAKRELTMPNGKPLIAIESLNAATDILGNPYA